MNLHEQHRMLARKSAEIIDSVAYAYMSRCIDKIEEAGGDIREYEVVMTRSQAHIDSEMSFRVVYRPELRRVL